MRTRTRVRRGVLSYSCGTPSPMKRESVSWAPTPRFHVYRRWLGRHEYFSRLHGRVRLTDTTFHCAPLRSQTRGGDSLTIANDWSEIGAANVRCSVGIMSYNTSNTHVGIWDICCIQTSFKSEKSSSDSHVSPFFSLGGVMSTHEVGRLVFAAAPRSTLDGTYLPA